MPTPATPTPSSGGDSPVGYAFGAFIFVVVVIAIIVCCIRTAPDATLRCAVAFSCRARKRLWHRACPWRHTRARARGLRESARPLVRVRHT